MKRVYLALILASSTCIACAADPSSSAYTCKFSGRAVTAQELGLAERAASDVGSASVIAELSLVLSRAGHVKDAEARAEEAMSLWRRRPSVATAEAMFRMAERYAKSAFCSKAALMFEQAALMADTLPGQSALALDSWVNMIAIADIARQPDLLRRAGGMTAKAIEKGVQIKAHYGAALLAYATSLLNDNKLSEAESFIDKVLSNKPADFTEDELIIVKAAAQFRQLRYQEGKATIARIDDRGFGVAYPLRDIDRRIEGIRISFRERSRAAALAQAEDALSLQRRERAQVMAKVESARLAAKEQGTPAPPNLLVLERAVEKEHADVGRIELVKGEILHSMNRLAEAERAYGGALSSLEAARQLNGVDAAGVHAALGHLYRVTKRPDLARASQQRALEIFSLMFGEMHPDSLLCKEELALLAEAARFPTKTKP
jgi:predicted negative regulator of RcsB-dependent stress response